MHLRRLVSVLALLAVVLVAAWLLFPKPDRAAGAVEKSATAGPNSAANASLPSTASSAPARSSSAALSSPASVAAPSIVANRAGVPTPPVARSATATVLTPPGAGPDAAATLAVDHARLMFRDYRTLMGENPVGTNAEIMRALMGDNPRQATVGPPEGQTLNADGELVDRWDTPLFFHQLSKSVMEIRSAGPDKIMGTDDDIVAR